ncbi:acyl-CoA N-acyltransferase, partial [Gyrodon lividus]
MQLTTENISLLFDTTSEPYSPHETLLDDLWNTLRKNAVEPGQASSPAFASFADECLLCAQIATTPKHSVRDKGGDQDVNALWGSQTPRSGCVVQTSTQPNIPSPLDSPLSSRAGLVYVHAGPANVTAGEANIGIILRPEMQRRGYAREAIQLVLRWAFEELKFHRVQAAILDSPCKDRALRLFIGLGFSHEGTRRRAVYQPEGDGIAGVWRDVTYLAMLDTEWVLRNVGKGKIPKQPVISVWDEMFARHAREQEQLLKWEENHGRMTRSASTETLREENRGTRDERELVDQITRF